MSLTDEHDLLELVQQAIKEASSDQVVLRCAVADQVVARLTWIAEMEARITATGAELTQQRERLTRLEAQLPYLPRARQALAELVAALEQTRAELRRHAAAFPPGVAVTDQWLAGIRRLIEEMALPEE